MWTGLELPLVTSDCVMPTTGKNRSNLYWSRFVTHMHDTIFIIENRCSTTNSGISHLATVIEFGQYNLKVSCFISFDPISIGS